MEFPKGSMYSITLDLTSLVKFPSVSVNKGMMPEVKLVSEAQPTDTNNRGVYFH